MPKLRADKLRGKAKGRSACPPPAPIPPSTSRPRAPAAAPFTLGVDIGGTNIKASVLDAAGVLAAEQIRSPTPKPATPQAVLDTIARLAAQLPPFHRISVGLPGRRAAAAGSSPPPISAPSYWAGFQLIEALAERFGTPVRLLNDAAVQGLGVVAGPRASNAC